MPKVLVALAIAIILIPLAFFAGKGCAPRTATISMHDTVTVPGAIVYFPATDSTPARALSPKNFRFTATPLPTVAVSGSPTGSTPTDSTSTNPTIAKGLNSPFESFRICSGSRMPSGDSVFVCFEAPLNQFTIEQFISNRITPVEPRLASPQTLGLLEHAAFPGIRSPPLHTQFYGLAEVSTRDMFAIGLGIETTASGVNIDSIGNVSFVDKLRISGEALAVPKAPWGYLKLRGSYFF